MGNLLTEIAFIKKRNQIQIEMLFSEKPFRRSSPFNDNFTKLGPAKHYLFN